MRPSALPNSPITNPNPKTEVPSRPEWRDLLFIIRSIKSKWEAQSSPLSSRPKRSAVEGSAVRPSALPNSP